MQTSSHNRRAALPNIRQPGRSDSQKYPGVPTSPARQTAVPAPFEKERQSGKEIKMNDKDKRTTKRNYTLILRHIIQLAAFVLFPGMFIIIFNALKSLVTAVAAGNFSLTALAGPLFITASVLLITMLWGRFFCGYLCSFGAMGDLLYSVSAKILPFDIAFSQPVERWLKRIKYLILLGLAVGVWIIGWSLNASLSPWNAFGLLTSWKLSSAGNAVHTTGFILLLLIAAASCLEERFFCRYLCPLGAVFSLVSRWRLFRIRRKPDACVDCARCTSHCSMGLDVMHTETVASGECIDCMNCMNVCPAHALNANPNPAVAGTAAAVAVAGLVFIGNVKVPEYIQQSAGSSYQASDGSGSSSSGSSSDSSDRSSGSSSGSSSSGQYKDGTYEGSGTGYRGTTSVKVTVKNGEITDITVESYEDDEQFFSKAESTVIDEILSEQSVNVSTVSGATYSSNGIMEAVADALGISFDNPNSSSGLNGDARR